MTDQQRILVVDDTRDNREILRVRLESQGFLVDEASDGQEAIEKTRTFAPDLIIMDIMMPVMDGISATSKIKQDDANGYIPIILLTAKSDTRTVIEGLEAGADEFLSKPVDHAALIARVRAMFRIKNLQDQLAKQSQELAALNSSLEKKVTDQIAQLEQVGRLRDFLPPQVVEIITDPDQRRDLLASHRAEVSVVFSDLRGFTPFAEAAEPEDIIDVLREYHDAVGQSAFRHGGTIERFAGDGVMVFFNDPVPFEDHQKRAVAFGFDVLSLVANLSCGWRERDIELGVGIGVASGFATLGRVGFNRKWDYAAIGNVTNLAARLCSMANSGELLATQRVARSAEEIAQVVAEARLEIKGLSRPVNVMTLKEISKIA